MNKYKLMNKILEEEGTYEMTEAEETSFAEHEASEYIMMILKRMCKKR